MTTVQYSLQEALNILVRSLLPADQGFTDPELFGQGMGVTVNLVPVGSHVTNTSVSSVVNITASKPAGGQKVLLQTISQPIRYTLDGTNPTTTSGFRLIPEDGEKLIPISGETVLKVIQESVAATIEYQWFK